MNWTKQQVVEYYDKLRRPVPPLEKSPAVDIVVRSKEPRDRMNKTERLYSQLLELERVTGEISAWWFESVKLRLADNTYYTPDFAVMRGGKLEFHEVKGGFWRDDARVKIKVAAELYKPFKFISMFKIREKDGGGWKREEF